MNKALEGGGSYCITSYSNHENIHLLSWNMSNNFQGFNGSILNSIDPSNQPPHFNPVTGKVTGGGEWNRTSSYMESRGRLKFDAIMGKELSGTAYFEMDSQTWGDVTSGTRSRGTEEATGRATALASRSRTSISMLRSHIVPFRSP